MSRPAPGWLIAGLRITLLSLVALAVLLGTGWLAAAGLTLVYGGDLATPGNLAVGVVCSLIACLFLAAFHLRKTTLTLPAPERERFIQSARIVLIEMGYEVKARGPAELSTRPRFHSLLIGGDVQVAMLGSHGRLTGPRLCVEILRKRLREQAHLNLVQQSLREPRYSETLIKRAELHLRVKPEDLEVIRTNVIEVLQGSAEVICDLHLLAQSETGIPESLLEFQVVQWLAQQGIDATLHKHFVQRHRNMSSTDVMLEDTLK